MLFLQVLESKRTAELDVLLVNLLAALVVDLDIDAGKLL
jgi:hypothetical protein